MASWTMEERRAVHALWGEEPWPVGWRAWRDRLAFALGEDTALVRAESVWVGGDAVLAILALRAAARACPSGVHLWCPPLGWEEAPVVWAALPETEHRLSRLLGLPEGLSMADMLGRVAADSRALVGVHGGSIARIEGEVVSTPHTSRPGFLWVARPSRTGAWVPRGHAEDSLRALHARALRHLELWPSKKASLVGGSCAKIHDIVAEIWLKSGEKRSIIHEEPLSFSPPRSISEGMSLWWEAVESLIRHVPTEKTEPCA